LHGIQTNHQTLSEKDSLQSQTEVLSPTSA
jgi:hypothetical protein